MSLFVVSLSKIGGGLYEGQGSDGAKAGEIDQALPLTSRS